MPVESNAQVDELSSPFFKRNELVCKEFDEFVSNHGGKTKGKYNAFSYHVSGIVSGTYDWHLQIKKASYSYSNLLISSEKQGLFVSVEWNAIISDFESQPFEIRPKKSFSFLGRLLSFSWKTHWEFQDYMIRANSQGTSLLEKLESVLLKLFYSGEVYSISFLENELKIELRTDSNQFEIFKKLLTLKN